MPTFDEHRRGFLGRLASGALALAGLASLDAGTARAATLLAGDAGAGRDDADSPYDDRWTDRVRAAKHKAVFDSPDVNDGLALLQPWIFRSGYRAALQAAPEEIVPVVVLRHQGTALAMDDAIWAKYAFGTDRKVTDPATGKLAERNPWARRREGETPDPTFEAVLGGPIDPTVAGVLAMGGVVLACEVAMKSFSRMLAKKVKGDAPAIFAELRAGVIPGVLVQPSGVYATTRAQEAGCTFMRSN
jgi:hypothetical protein